MVYASSKDALRKQLVGIAAEIQATSYDEITYDAGEWTFYLLKAEGSKLTPSVDIALQSSTSVLVVKRRLSRSRRLREEGLGCRRAQTGCVVGIVA